MRQIEPEIGCKPRFPRLHDIIESAWRWHQAHKPERRSHSTCNSFSAESPPSPVPGKVSACGSLMIYTIFKDQSGEYRWRLCARNYIVIAISGEGYKNHKDCSDSIDLVKESSSAPVIDATNKGSSERPRIAAENLGIVGERRAGIARVLKILLQFLSLLILIFIFITSRLLKFASPLTLISTQTLIKSLQSPVSNCWRTFEPVGKRRGGERAGRIALLHPGAAEVFRTSEVALSCFHSAV